jgi:phage shock protein A
MRVNLPDPLGVIALGQSALDQAASLLPRTVALLGEAESLVRRAHDLVDRIEGTRAAADAVVERTDQVVTDANALIVRAAGTLASVEPTVERAQRLLDSFTPSLEALQPTLERLGRTTKPDEVEALVRLIDHLPMLVGRIEDDVVPILENMDTVGDDIHDLLDMATEINEMIARLPGMGRVRKRIDEEQATENR